ncbi:nicotinate-nucleotide adenylyltransferase [Acidithiobacillus sp. IBUN Pt1247-S3]|uniref:nicotinate-nucleotide adenylyltransferase n=1 Tax=Acidithiobacillus sp. IBUN Pt1247-S3 TaxID=3166642 RepID=UPI0034E414D0
MQKTSLFLGGTFDPIHYGHLRALEEVREALGMEQATLIPAGDPPHRGSPWAPAEHRLAMARAAASQAPGIEVLAFEVEQSGPSYTIETVHELRRQNPEGFLAMVIGMDAFLRFDTWRDWENILELTHLVVIGRPGWPMAELPEGLRQALYQRRVDELAQLHRTPAGKIAFHTVTALEISASHIRSLLAAGRSARFLLPNAVLDYITEHRLYHEA